MADISKDQIKLMASEVLADTEDGGGQMTSNEIVDGAVNNLFPDISRLDRTYGRVSLRKAYMSVQTDDRATYYGAHVALTEQATDPLVSTTLFTTEDWFDTRDNCRDRIESYLAKGPQYLVALFGNHYRGTKSLMFFGHTGISAPEIGDTLVLSDDENEQYVRVVDASKEAMAFMDDVGGTFSKDVVTVEIGSGLESDFEGLTASKSISFTTLETTILTTVVADASNYYSITKLADAASTGELSVKVDSIYANIVPSSKTQTAITDFGVGMVRPAMVSTGDSTYSINSSLNLDGTTVLGYDISPGSLSFSGGGVSIADNGNGTIKNTLSGSIVGAIAYENGTLTLDGSLGTTVISGTYSFTPAVAYGLPTCTGSIDVSSNNRGYVYVFNCIPSPKAGTLRVDYMAEGKWYTMSDIGLGVLSGSDSTIGTGLVNLTTGSVSLTLGSQPDADSSILLYWGTEIQVDELPEYEGNGAINCKVPFALETSPGIGSLHIGWVVGSDSYYVEAKVDGNFDFYKNDTLVDTDVGRIDYVTQEGWFAPPVTLNEGTVLSVSYVDAGTSKVTESITADGTDELTTRLNNTEPILPGSVIAHMTFTIVAESVPDWGTITSYQVEPGYEQIYVSLADNGNGTLTGSSNGITGTIDYDTGDISIETTIYTLARFLKTQTLAVSDITYGSVAYERNYESLVELNRTYTVSAGVGISVEYLTDATTTEYNESLTAVPVYKIDVPNNSFIIPGSIWATIESLGDIYDDSQGNIKNVSTGVTIGSINYNTGEISILSEMEDITKNRSCAITAGSAAFDLEERTAWRFRCPGSPITPGSFTIQATSKEGAILSATADFDGNVLGDKINGEIDYQTGVVKLAFGEWLVASEHTGEDWLTYAPTDDAGNAYKFEYVLPSTIVMNCVIESYLPLDADLLGLDTVRLPMDGRVPAFRDGYIVLIHHTQTEVAGTPTAGQVVTLSRQNVNLIELYDNDGVYVTETGNYSSDLTDGTITFEDPLDLSAYASPFHAITRIEDMVIATDVQITGHIAVSQPLQHDYPADETLVSGVLPIGDVQARIYNEFTDSSWGNVWQDTRKYSPTTAQYDLVNYPIIVTNRGSVRERFACIFTSTSVVNVVGEHLGVILSGAPIGGDISPINPASGQPYFTIRKEGWGSGWATGQVLRFNSDAGNYPIWFCRTTQQGPATENNDHYCIQIRGDAS